MTALYTSGTISLVNGSAVITGIDTAWETALIVGGTVYAEAEGNPLPILPDDSAGASEHPITDTQMTAAIKWQGATGTYKYALVRENTYTTAQAANSVKIAELLQQLNYPTIAAIAAIQGEQDHLILLTGPSTATTIARSSLGTVTGPNDVTDGAFAGFDGETGDLLKELTGAQALAILKSAGAYAKDNFLGTVSQVSGVPTGAAMEPGNNANGRYWRDADGFQACIKFVAVGSISIGAGGFQSYSLGTHAAAFAATPFEVPVYIGDNSLLVTIGLESVSNTYAGNGVLRNNLNEARTFNGSIGVLAVGRWF